MKCQNCNQELRDGDSFCEFYGSSVVKKRKKMGVVSIISLVILALNLLTPVFTLLYTSAVSKDLDVTSAQGYGWIFIIVCLVCFFTVPYYAITFIISLVFDFFNKNTTIKNAIIIFFLILPIILFIGFAIFIYFFGSKI